MKKIAIALISLIPTLSLAAPTGHEICKGTIDGNKIEFIYGTYALAGDAELKINGKKYEFSADFDSNPGGGLVFTANDPQVGSIRWISSSEGASQIPLSVNVAGTKFDDKIIQCKTMDYKMGNEQN